jgi:hypothetical protein
MDKIYNQASSVFIWLGNEDEDTKPAIKDLEFLASNAKREGLKSYFDVDWDNDSFDRSILEIMGSYIADKQDNWPAVFRFFQKDWWRRVWVLQEAQLARSACMACGTERIDWSDIIAFLCLMLLTITRSRHLQLESRVGLEMVFSRITALGTLSVFHFAEVTRANGNLQYLFTSLVHAAKNNLLATKPRDRVYSLLALMAERYRSKITVDYTEKWTVKELYMQVTEILLQENGFNSLGMASAANKQSEEGLPHWVLDCESCSI